MNEIDFSRFSILVVDDEAGIRFGLRNWLKKRFPVFDCGEYEEAIQLAKSTKIDVVVLDVRLAGDKTGIDLFRELLTIHPDLIAILVTGYGNVEDAVSILKEGANDYLLKPVDHDKLLATIRKAIEIKHLREENKSLKKELIKRDYPHDFITLNERMIAIKTKADKIKNKPVPICITGESGTGKEVLARYIHFTSNRQEKPFVVLNCAAISETLLLSELFGHEKGAFTGANQSKIGKFQLAGTGTLFLDEIGDMSSSNQAALLRVLETGSFERIGGNKTISVDVRIITATNQDLKQRVEDREFREDLYYRINVVHMELPALRDRKSEIPSLINHFLQVYNIRYKKDITKFSDEAVSLLRSCDWPGNIRQLKNVVNETILLSDSDEIQAEDIEYTPVFSQKKRWSKPDFEALNSLQEELDRITEEYEKTLIEHFLAKHQGNQSQTAKRLKIDRKTLWRKMRKYQITND